MLVDFRDPESIAAWVRVRPREHWAQVRAIVRLHSQWRDAARAAQELLKQPKGSALER